MKKKLLCGLLSLAMISTNYSITFAGSGDSLSVGCDMRKTSQDAAISTIPEAKYSRNQFERAGYNGYLVTSPSPSEITDNKLDSSVLYLSGHGGKNEISWPYRDFDITADITSAGFPSGKYSISIAQKSFDNIKVAILAACNAGQSGGLAESFYRKGAQLSFGWNTKVEYSPMRDFGYLLTEYLADGKKFADALPYVYADMAAGNTESGFEWDTIDYTQDPDDRPPYYNISMYGNYNISIKKSRNVDNEKEATFTKENSDITIYKDIENLNHTVGSNEFSDIAQYIQNNISSKFNLDDFTYNEVETFDESGDSLITFRYMVDDFKSDFGFNVIVIDGKVEEIVKVGEELYDLDFDSSVAKDSLETSLLTTNSNETNDIMVIK